MLYIYPGTYYVVYIICGLTQRLKRPKNSTGQAVRRRISAEMHTGLVWGRRRVLASKAQRRIQYVASTGDPLLSRNL